MKASPLWTSWFRLGTRSPWRKVGKADTEAEAWRGVLAYPPAGDKTVCRPGAGPSKEKLR